jgi:hypothetical protein
MRGMVRQYPALVGHYGRLRRQSIIDGWGERPNSWKYRGGCLKCCASFILMTSSAFVVTTSTACCSRTAATKMWLDVRTTLVVKRHLKILFSPLQCRMK